MKKGRFTEHQIVSALKKQEAGIAVKDISRELGISDATFYNWKAKYGGMETSDVAKLKDLERENSELKIVNKLKAIGMTTATTLPTSGKPVVYGSWENAPEKPTVLIYAHYDVQPVKD